MSRGVPLAVAAGVSREVVYVSPKMDWISLIKILRERASKAACQIGGEWRIVSKPSHPDHWLGDCLPVACDLVPFPTLFFCLLYPQ